MSGQPHSDLSLFPLGIVAVPSEGVPLHIFEDRYLRMIEDCLSAAPGSPARAFGIVWLSDQELKQVGCACEVERVLERTSDGHMNILARAKTPFRLLGVGILLAVREELDRARRIRLLVLALDQPERTRAAREDVQPAVVVALQNPLDQACAAHGLELILGQPHDPELAALRLALALQAGADHAPVALLEDVQRDGLAGQRHYPEREQGEGRRGLLVHV